MSKRSRPLDDAELREVVRALSAVPPVALATPHRWRQELAHGGLARRTRPVRLRPTARWVGSAAATVVAAAVAATLLLSGPTADQAVALPVFSLPAVDASQIRAATEVLTRSHADYAQARVISTPGGRGYVVPAENGSVCLAVPDQGGGFAQSCATQEMIAERGLVVELSSPRRAGSQVVVVVPAGTTDAQLRDGDDGTIDPVDAVDGVLSASVDGPAELSFETPAGHVVLPLAVRIRCVELSPGTSAQAEKEIVAQSGRPICGSADDPTRRP